MAQQKIPHTEEGRHCWQELSHRGTEVTEALSLPRELEIYILAASA